jgi:hypothetical protein
MDYCHVCISDYVWSHLRNCRPAADIVFSLEQEMCVTGFLSSKNATLLALEKALTKMTAYSLTEGVFYALTIQFGRDTVIRFIEAATLASEKLPTASAVIQSCY